MNITEKIGLIRKLVADNGITAYDIGKNTEISLTSARNVLEDDAITPRTKTLHIILEYLENVIAGTQKNNGLKPEYPIEISGTSNADFKKSSIEEKLNKLYAESLLHSKQLEIISNTLGVLKLNQDDFIEAFKKKMD